MIRRYTYIIMVLVGVFLTACDVHQWPEQHVNPPSGPTPDPNPDPGPSPDIPKVTIPLRLEYETDFYVWEHKYDPVLGTIEEINPSLDIYPDYPGTSSKYTNVVPTGLVQTYVKVFPVSEPSRCVAEQTFTYEVNGSYDTDLELEIPENNLYNIIVWSQLLETSEALSFYDPSNFSQIHIVPDNYKGNTDYRDGYRGWLRVDATTAATTQNVIRMKRPMGKFELVTTDLSEFLDRETEVRHLSARASANDYRIVIAFPMYYPSSYSALDDRLENASTGVAFETRMMVTGDSEASLGFEYVMQGDNADGGVQTSVSVYRLDGTRVASSSVFTIPMRRNHHTLLRGAFLTMEGSGGVGIDPSFNGDHNITWQ